MKIFLTGATGYIGGAIATHLAQHGHEVHGLCRDPEKSAALQKRNILPVLGTLADERLLTERSRMADAVINAADADDPYAVQALLRGLEGTGKRLLHTSGSSVVGDRANGAASEVIFTEDTPRPVRWEKLGRCEIDRAVLQASAKGVAAVVLCPCLIYGRGDGPHPESIQIPRLIASARRHGAARYIGAGENVWSTVQIDDVVAAYELALDRAPAGSFFFLENGSVSFGDLARGVHRTLGLPGDAVSWSVEEAALEWGQEGAHFAFGSNSRISAAKAKAVLNWKPTYREALEDLPRCVGAVESA